MKTQKDVLLERLKKQNFVYANENRRLHRLMNSVQTRERRADRASKRFRLMQGSAIMLGKLLLTHPLYTASGSDITLAAFDLAKRLDEHIEKEVP